MWSDTVGMILVAAIVAAGIGFEIWHLVKK